jgi:hypothetical protein
MASQVKSQLSDKVYESTLDDLLETDQGLEVDLYKINIFNKDIAIAPGKVMHDAKKDVYYCYVYAIVDKRVAAKLGVYETRDTRGEIYDLSQFEEGSLLLFDSYIQDTSALIEFQMPEAPEASDNIFDYLKQYIKPVTNEQATIKTQQSLFKKINMRMTEKFSDQTDLLRVVKLFKLQRPYDEDFLDSLKAESPDRWMFILIILELVFQVKFEFNVEGADELRNMVKERPNTSTDVILVSLDEIPRHVEEFKPVKEEGVEETKEGVEEEKEEELEEIKETPIVASQVEEEIKETPSMESVEEPFESTSFKSKTVLKPKTKRPSRLLEPIGEVPRQTFRSERVLEPSLSEAVASEAVASEAVASEAASSEPSVSKAALSEAKGSEQSVSEATGSVPKSIASKPKPTPRRSLKREETPKIKRNNAPPLVLASKNNKL